ncbi:hypothetical protein SUDANB96_06581 [Streptomyces sp. enrichment culture]
MEVAGCTNASRQTVSDSEPVGGTKPARMRATVAARPCSPHGSSRCAGRVRRRVQGRGSVPAVEWRESAPRRRRRERARSLRHLSMPVCRARRERTTGRSHGRHGDAVEVVDMPALVVPAVATTPTMSAGSGYARSAARRLPPVTRCPLVGAGEGLDTDDPQRVVGGGVGLSDTAILSGTRSPRSRVQRAVLRAVTSTDRFPASRRRRSSRRRPPASRPRRRSASGPVVHIACTGQPWKQLTHALGPTGAGPPTAPSPALPQHAYWTPWHRS